VARTHLDNGDDPGCHQLGSIPAVTVGLGPVARRRKGERECLVPRAAITVLVLGSELSLWFLPFRFPGPHLSRAGMLTILTLVWLQSSTPCLLRHHIPLNQTS